MALICGPNIPLSSAARACRLTPGRPHSIQRLKLNYHKSHSNFGFNFNLCSYRAEVLAMRLLAELPVCKAGLAILADFYAR